MGSLQTEQGVDDNFKRLLSEPTRRLRENQNENNEACFEKNCVLLKFVLEMATSGLNFTRK